MMKKIAGMASATNHFAKRVPASSVFSSRDVRSRAARFGGSHAQRDVIDLTIIEAAARNGDLPLRDALLAERANALPV